MNIDFGRDGGSEHTVLSNVANNFVHECCFQLSYWLDQIEIFIKIAQALEFRFKTIFLKIVIKPQVSVYLIATYVRDTAQTGHFCKL